MNIILVLSYVFSGIITVLLISSIILCHLGALPEDEDDEHES